MKLEFSRQRILVEAQTKEDEKLLESILPDINLEMRRFFGKEAPTVVPPEAKGSEPEVVAEAPKAAGE